MEKKYFVLDGLTGFGIAVAGLLITFGILTTNAINIQQTEVNNAYTLDTSLHGLKANNALEEQEKFYKLQGK